MTRDDIIAMARQAGINVEQGFLLRFAGVEADLERFATLVAAAEREACCNLLEGMHVAGTGSHNYYLHAATELRRLRNARSTT